LKLRNLEDGDQLPFFNAISHIDINSFHVTGNFRVDIDYLIGPKFRSHGESPCKVRAEYFCRRNCWRGRGIWSIFGGIGRAGSDQKSACNVAHEAERFPRVQSGSTIGSMHGIAPRYFLNRPVLAAFDSVLRLRNTSRSFSSEKSADLQMAMARSSFS